MNIRIIEIIGIGAVLAVVLAAVGRSVLSLNKPVDDVDAIETKAPTRRRRFTLPLALVAVVALASTSVGVTLALYSNRPTGETNTFVAGTVGLTNVVTGACLASTNNMAPADTASCTMLTTYAGNLSGYMSLDVFIATVMNNTAGGGAGVATNLYNPGASLDADITVSSTSPTVNYVVAGGSPTSFGTAITCPGAGTSLDGNSYTGYNLCYQLSNLLVSATAFTVASGQVTFTTGISLPLSQPNTYQGSSAVVVLSAHAVQSRNNSINCAVGGASPTAGAVCTPAGSFAWS
jgi:hypothetical protein